MSRLLFEPSRATKSCRGATGRQRFPTGGLSACSPTGRERWARVPAAARGSLPGGSRGSKPLRTRNLCICPPDEKEESILGSIPLLSFRVAAVQPSDNISRKHTFKVSAWLCRGLEKTEHWGGGDARRVPAAPSSCFLGDGMRSKLGKGVTAVNPRPLGKPCALCRRAFCWGN